MYCDFFHSIRFKVNKVRGQGVAPFLLPYSRDRENIFIIMRILIILLFVINAFTTYSSEIKRLIEINCSPEELMIKTDSIEKVGDMDSYKLNYLRSFTCFSLTNKQSLLHWQILS